MSQTAAGQAVPVNRVRILPERVVNQIAAGEVVERPASVIKELVENSLDAGARRVLVSIRNGGKSLIEVADDGEGMSRDDAVLAFERHATSKIRDSEDIKTVSTLGFRGEALAAIASVSRTLMSVCARGAPVGTDVAVEGGRLADVRDGPPIPGARIQARDLFYNAPARRKFLRSERSEAEKAEETVIRLALARPDVAFTFTRDGKTVLDLPSHSGEGALMKRIEGIFGEKFASGLHPARHSASGMSAAGFISRPGHNLDGGPRQHIYLNGRFIRDRLVSFAVMEGYHSLLPRGAHPAYILFLEIPPGQVDVNVHPAKMEVRFRDGREVVGLVKTAVLGAIISLKGSPPARASAVEPGWRGEPAAEAPSGPAWPAAPAPSQRRAFHEPVAEILYSGGSAAEREAHGGAAVFDAALFEPFNGALSPDVRVVGQLFRSFIVAEDGDRALLFDQHTIHERILRERISTRLSSGGVDSQELLFPFEIEAPRGTDRRVERSLPILRKLGFALEEFGDRAYAVRSAPAVLSGKDPRQAVLDILRAVGAMGSAEPSRILEESVNIMACRAAVKAGQALAAAEMESLLRQLGECVLPYTCPHGRPVAVSVPRENLLKAFLRK